MKIFKPAVMTKFIYSLAAFVVLLAPQLHAGQPGTPRKVEYRIEAAYGIGGRTPLGLPAEIRKVNSYRPLANVSIGAYATRMFTPKWGLSGGLRVETKGMKVASDVRNYRITVNIHNGDAQGTKSGYYTGSISNKSQVQYLTVPVLVVFRPNDRWELHGGLYASYAIDRVFTGGADGGYIRETPLHPKIGVKEGSYDYSSDLRRGDFGLELGAGLRVYRELSVGCNLLWGFVDNLNPATRSIDLSMYNVFLNVGLSYRFR